MKSSRHCRFNGAMETLTELDSLRRRHQPPTAGSTMEAKALARFGRFFSSFAPDRVQALLPQTYATEVYFNDTVKTVRGREALQRYLSESAAAVEDCRVEILDVTRNSDDEHLLRWRMLIRFRRFHRGQNTWTVGMSHLRFNAEGLVVYHQDYWNAADGIYRYVPVLGWMIRAIQKRL